MRAPDLPSFQSLFPPGFTVINNSNERGARPAGLAMALWVIVLTAVLWFALLGYRDLADPDEGRYAEIAREIVATGDWVTMRLNGVEYFAKPPFQFWATAATFKLFGEGNGAARLSLSLLGFAGALWVGYVGRRLFGKDAGFMAFAVLASSLLYVALGHILTPNMSVTVFMTFGIGALLLAQSRREEPAKVRRWMLFGWAALGLAILSKGLMGVVLPGATVFVYMLWQRDWQLLRNLHLGAGLGVMILITAPWFVAVSIANPDFPNVFFLQEHFERYTEETFRRDQPLYYFVPVLAIAMLPWLPSLARELVRPRFAWWPQRGQGFDPERFLWTYAILIFVFFSLGSSKLPSYLLPMSPALALLIGKGLSERRTASPDILAAGILGSVLLAAGILVERFASSSFPPELLVGYRPWLLAAGLVLVVGALAAFRTRARQHLAVGVMAVSALLAFQLAGWGYQAVQEPRSSAAEADAIRPLLDAETPLFSVGRYSPSLSFYLARTADLVKIRPRREFDFLRERYDDLTSAADFRRSWDTREGQAVAVFRTDDLADPVFEGIPGRVIYQTDTKTALARQ